MYAAGKQRCCAPLPDRRLCEHRAAKFARRWLAALISPPAHATYQ